MRCLAIYLSCHITYAVELKHSICRYFRKYIFSSVITEFKYDTVKLDTLALLNLGKT